MCKMREENEEMKRYGYVQRKRPVEVKREGEEEWEESLEMLEGCLLIFVIKECLSRCCCIIVLILN